MLDKFDGRNILTAVLFLQSDHPLKEFISGRLKDLYFIMEKLYGKNAHEKEKMWLNMLETKEFSKLCYSQVNLGDLETPQEAIGLKNTDPNPCENVLPNEYKEFRSISIRKNLP